MKHALAAFFAAVLLSLAPHAEAQSTQPRAVVERVAQLIADNYFDPPKGAEVAAMLRERAIAGAFDRYTNPGDLAAQISALIEPHDGHFRVEWSALAAAPGPQQAAAGPPPNMERFRRAVARANYGFARVEMLPGGIGYVDVRAFAHFQPDDADTSPARRAADAAMTMVANAEAIVIDLRDSAGGSPAMVGYLAAHFAPQGADIYNTFHSREGDSSEAPFVEPNGARILDRPLYILISGRTASAAESFAYTLQAAGRATVVGSASAGGANPGGYLPVADGFSVFVSRVSPENPITHDNWEGRGVQPDVAVASEQALDRARVLALEAIAAAPRDEDARAEAQWALAAFNARAAPVRNPRQYQGGYGQRSISVEQGRLLLRRDRRPALTLTPIEPDLFAVQDVAPQQRVRFERDERGRVVAFDLMLITGEVFRNTRD